MCEYCDMEPNGDIPVEREELIDHMVPLGDAIMFLDASIAGHRLEYGLHSKYFTVVDDYVEINYCPMCGRRLR